MILSLATSSIKLPEPTVYCRECDPPSRVDIPAGVYYRMQDADTVSCPNGHRGTLEDYKNAARDPAVRHGPFVRSDD
jgi:hypothetical protein